jgi:cyclohexanone monooxygenase
MSSRNAAPPDGLQPAGNSGETTSQALSARELALLEKYKLERNKRMRADGVAQFREIKGELAHFMDDPHVPPLQRDAGQEEVDVVVVGAGWSGMLTAIYLRKAGITNLRIIDSGGDFGGVWYWNRYPGCRCDVDSFIYMPLLEETGYIPTEKYATAAEVRAYAVQLAQQFDLYRHAVFQTRVTEVRWSDADARWIVSTHRGDTFKARFLFVGNGALNYPKLPGIPGIENFKGHSFHTSRWDYAYTGGNEQGNLTNLKDKRVALIGNGSSGVQAAAPLAQWAKQLYVVQRTPAVVGLRANKPTDAEWSKTLRPGWHRERMANFDGLLAGQTRGEDLVADQWTDLWAPPPPPPQDAGPLDVASLYQRIDIEKMDAIRARVETIVDDAATAEALKPWYNRFCKRPTFNDEFLPIFNRPNVKLVDTQGRGLDRITERAIVFDNQAYEVDCIVYATGFELLTISNKGGGFEIIGREGRTIDQKWDQAVRSLHGMYTHGFPNLFFVAGMRQSRPTVNFPFMANEQAAHGAQIVRLMLQENVKVMEVSQRAEDRWCDTIAAKARVDVNYLQACTPSFLNGEGDLSTLAKQAFHTAYGGGPFEYFDILKRWREQEVFDDLHLTRG